jgi:hypothetical protein
MNTTSWAVDVEGTRHTITVERDEQMRRSMIRVDGKMAGRPISDGEEEREIRVGGARYVVRRLEDGRFDLDVPPEVFLNPEAKPARARTHNAKPEKSGGRIGAIIGGVIVLAVVGGLLRVGREGLSYMRVPWKAYSDSEGTFKVNFPGDPKQSSETMNINGDLWNVISLESRYKNHIYAVEYVDAHMVITKKGAPDVLDRFLEGWMEAVSAKLVSKEPISLGRNPAISFIARLPKGSGEGEEKLPVDARQRGIIALRDKRIIVAWTLTAEADKVSWDIDKFFQSFEIPPPAAEREMLTAAMVDPAPPDPAPVAQAAPAPPPPTATGSDMPGITMTRPVARVYAHNKSKKYYPENCAARPPEAYPIARSLAESQGFTLAEECAAPGAR